MELCIRWTRILQIHGLWILVDSTLRRVDLLLVGLAVSFYSPSFFPRPPYCWKTGRLTLDVESILDLSGWMLLRDKHRVKIPECRFDES